MYLARHEGKPAAGGQSAVPGTQKAALQVPEGRLKPRWHPRLLRSDARKVVSIRDCQVARLLWVALRAEWHVVSIRPDAGCWRLDAGKGGFETRPYGAELQAGVSVPAKDCLGYSRIQLSKSRPCRSLGRPWNWAPVPRDRKTAKASFACCGQNSLKSNFRLREQASRIGRERKPAEGSEKVQKALSVPCYSKDRCVALPLY